MKTTSQGSKQEHRQDFTTFQNDLRALRDEVKLKLHLAEMDLREEWEKFEPRVERVVNSAVTVSSEVVSDLKKRLAEFKERLRS